MNVLHLALEFYYSYYNLSTVLTYYKGLIKDPFESVFHGYSRNILICLFLLLDSRLTFWLKLLQIFILRLKILMAILLKGYTYMSMNVKLPSEHRVKR